jgi:hypothetical protein
MVSRGLLRPESEIGGCLARRWPLGRPMLPPQKHFIASLM